MHDNDIPASNARQVATVGLTSSEAVIAQHSDTTASSHHTFKNCHWVKTGMSQHPIINVSIAMDEA